MKSFILITFLLVLLTCSSTAEETRSNNLETNYLITASHLLRPGSIYGVTVSLFGSEDESRAIFVQAEITKDDEYVASADVVADLHESSTAFMKIPQSVSDGNYKLKVQGKLNNERGKLVFVNETSIQFSSQFLGIIIQTNRPVYRAGQTVYFRIILLTTDLKPYEDTVNIYILDPDGIIMRRWISIQLNNGVVSHKFVLPKLTKDGFWKIRSEAYQQVEEQEIKVETYFTPLFEVFVKMPAFAYETEENIKANVMGRSEFERIVTGNATIRIYGRRKSNSYVLISEEHDYITEKEHEVLIDMESVRHVMRNLSDVEIRLEATITDLLHGETSSGFSHTKITSKFLQLNFLGPSPMVFKPGMPFEGHIAVSYSDHSYIDEEKLLGSTVTIQVTFELIDGGSINLPEIVIQPEFFGNVVAEESLLETEENNYVDDKTDLYRYIDTSDYLNLGVLLLQIDSPKDAKMLYLKCHYNDIDGDEVKRESSAISYHSPHNNFIRVLSRTKNALIGEFCIFHVKTSFRLRYFHYVIVSKGLLLNGGKQTVEELNPTTTSFGIPISSSMAPGFHILVYYILENTEIIADSLFIPVNGFKQYETVLQFNQGKDHTMKTTEIIMNGEAGSFMGISGMRAEVFMTQAGNEITESRVMETMFMSDRIRRVASKIMWTSKDGMLPDSVTYLMSLSHARNVNLTFSYMGLIVFTNAIMPSLMNSDICQEGYLPCLTTGCFPALKECDREIDCVDESDENYCEYKPDDHYHYRLSRSSHNSEFYDSSPDGVDWAWTEMNGEYGGDEFFSLDVPQVSDDWYFTGFTLSKKYGFSIIDSPVHFSSARPFSMHLQGPSFCRRGEQIGLRTLLINNEEYEMFVIIILHGSSEYKFVHVEEGGYVSSYGARLSEGEHQHLVYLPPKSQQQVDVPITPAIEQGRISVKVTASTQVGTREVEHTIDVLGEGGMVKKHTSVLLDLKNRALVLHYLDIIVEETPLIPYDENRRYVYGSLSGLITLTGNLIGPIPTEEAVTTEAAVELSTKGTESRIFELATSVWTLHYFRLTNNLKSKDLKQMLEEVNVIFAHVMRRYNKNGWFSNWDTSQPSVWLTAWSIRIFDDAMFPEWVDYIYIESSIFTNCTKWLLKFQNEHGSFMETDSYDKPLDAKMKANHSIGSFLTHNITLTAHVLITLQKVIKFVEGDLKSDTNNARIQAMRYLEKLLPHMQDPYELSITAYALTISGSSSKEYAATLLQSKIRESGDGERYWSRIPVKPRHIKYQNQRPFILAREFEDDDSVAVETTSYALLVFLMTDGITMITEKIVEWLISLKMTMNGFISTIDTAVALQALTEYSFRSHLMDINNMAITLELPTSDGFRETVYIKKKSLTQPYTLEIPNKWGHLNVIGKGSGQAVLQMDIAYGTDNNQYLDKPETNNFDLEIKEFYSSYRNKSAVTIQSCFRWIRNDSSNSGAVVLEIDLPTGYHLTETDAVRIVEENLHPTLRDAKTQEGKTIWFFDHVTGEKTCFNHTVKRWFPVANMTQYRQALMYESYAREHFIQILIKSTPLYILNICEVCGSYQCPYCPHYSHSARIVNDITVTLNSLCLVTILKLFSI